MPISVFKSFCCRCEVDFATKTGVIDGEVSLSFMRVRKRKNDIKCSSSGTTNHCPVTNVTDSDVGAATDVATSGSSAQCVNDLHSEAS